MLNSSNKHTSAIFINQTRQKIGVTFGSPTTTSGGLAMGFYASYRISFTRIEKVSESVKQWDGDKYIDAKQVVAHRIKATLEKSKLSAPHSDAVFLYDLKSGEVDELSYLLGKALEKGLLTRNGAFWDIPGVLPAKVQGQANFVKYLNDNPDVIDWIKESA